MKIYNLLFCVYFFTSTAIQAQQTFTLTPNPIFGVNKSEDEVEAAATVKNLSINTETFRWKRTVIRLDHDSICQVPVTDPYLHFLPMVSARNFDLDPGQEGPLNVNLWDFEHSGCCAIIHMKVSRLTGTPDSIEAFYYLRECQPLATIDPEKSSIQLFPNPASQFFSLKNAESVRYLTLCDATGKMLKRIEANAENQYSVAGLPAGAYFLVAQNTGQRILQVLQLQKE